MSEFREQAIRDVAETSVLTVERVRGYADGLVSVNPVLSRLIPYAVSKGERVLELEAAIRWALGYGDFRERRLGEGAYWWRNELAERALLAEPEREKGR